MIKKEEAVITSASIEVNVIRIGNRQMTLAVFDQLPNGTEDARVYGIFGNVWGKVHRKDEWHIITEHEGVLQRINITGIIKGNLTRNRLDKDRINYMNEAKAKECIANILARNAQINHLQEVIDSQPQLFIAV